MVYNKTVTRKFIFGLLAALVSSAVIALSLLSVVYACEHGQCDERKFRETKAPLAVSGDNIYLTWWSNKTGLPEVMFRASNNAGQTFGDKINLSNTTNGTSFDTKIGASDDSVYVTWWDNQTGRVQLYFRGSNDAGQTFGEKIMINDIATPTGHQVSTDGQIATSGNTVYVVWPGVETAGGESDIFIRRSTDNGQTFQNIIDLGNTTGAESQDVEIAAEGDNVVVSWWERNATINEPVMRDITDNGQTFGPLLKLATNGTIGGEGE